MRIVLRTRKANLSGIPCAQTDRRTFNSGDGNQRLRIQSGLRAFAVSETKTSENKNRQGVRMSKKVEKADKADVAKVDETIHISPPNIRTGELWLKGTSPLVVHRFGDKARNMIREKQMAGSTANSKKKREAKDFEAVFNDARHISFDGWDGIPAAAFRASLIRACTLVGFKMTIAKMSIFIEADGYDRSEGVGLVKIIGGKPRQFESMVRLATGVCDISVRPQWLEWGCRIRFKYDADQFTANDVVNLVNRAGMQVGVCEGRPGSTNSNGMGWGTFEVSDEKSVMDLEKKGAK